MLYYLPYGIAYLCGEGDRESDYRLRDLAPTLDIRCVLLIKVIEK